MGGAALEPRQRARVVAERGLPSALAPAHDAVDARDLQQPLPAQIGLAVEIREVHRVHRQHHHTAKAAVRLRDAHGHGNLPAPRHAPEHRLAHVKPVPLGALLDPEVSAVRIVDKRRRPRAGDDVPPGVDDADDVEQRLACDLRAHPGAQVRGRAVAQIELAHHDRHLLGRLEHAEHLLLEGDGVVGIGLERRGHGLFALGDDALQRNEPKQADERAANQHDGEDLRHVRAQGPRGGLGARSFFAHLSLGIIVPHRRAPGHRAACLGQM